MTRKFSLIAALAILASIAASRPAQAQAQAESLGIRGVANVQIMDPASPGPGDYSASGLAATLGLYYQPDPPLPYPLGYISMEIGVDLPDRFGFLEEELKTFVEIGSAFTPTSGSGSFFAGGPFGIAANYSIGSDGSVVADLTRNIETGPPTNEGYIQVTFQGSTVPEPSSFSQAATAAVILIGIALWRAMRRARPSPTQA